MWGAAWCETNIVNSHRGDSEVTFYIDYRLQIPNLIF